MRAQGCLRKKRSRKFLCPRPKYLNYYKLAQCLRRIPQHGTIHYDWHFGVCIPPEDAARGAPWWQQLVAAFTPNEFVTGWVGLGIQWHSGFDSLTKNDDAVRTLGQWLLDYPGLTPGPNIVLPAVREGIRTVGWFTLLGEELAKRKGGIEGFRAMHADVSPLGAGLLMQAGESPRLTGGEDYQRVSRLVADLRVAQNAFPFHESGFGGVLRGKVLGDNFDRCVSRFD
jgi:hypothetical protein